jgi:hypothetical protein
VPLTALHGSDNRLIDATVATDEVWASIYKRRPLADLRCRSCGHAMFAKVSKLRLRHFAHAPRGPVCAFGKESEEHYALKSRLAAAARAAGWTAEIEALPGPGDVGGWKADVLAVAPNGSRRVALEAQVSPMPDGLERVERYERDGIESLWVTPGDPAWLWRLTSCRVPGAKIGSDDQLVVTAGYASFRRTEWRPTDISLDALVGAFLDSTAVRHVIHPPYALAGSGNVEPWAAVAVVPLADLGAERADKERRERERLRLAQEEAARQRAEREAEEGRQRARLERQRAKEERQLQALPSAVEYAEQLLQPGDSLWVGVPPVVVADARHVAFEAAVGDLSRAMALVVWVGPEPGRLRLVAVVCPDVALIDRSLSKFWDYHRMEVFAADAAEATRLTDKLNWHEGTVRIASTIPRREAGHTANPV